MPAIHSRISPNTSVSQDHFAERPWWEFDGLLSKIHADGRGDMQPLCLTTDPQAGFIHV